MQLLLTSDWHPAIHILQMRIQQELDAGRRVLWLVSGGSNTIASVTIMQGLRPDTTKNLTIMLADERYGAVGHADSNGAQLLAAGFHAGQATLLSILTPNTSFEATRDHYEALAIKAFSNCDIVVGQFGMGSDGHIAGILPRSTAASSTAFVAAYASHPYQRLTLTFRALKRVSVGYVLAYGADKKPALELLDSKLIPYTEQPAQIVKEMPEAYVFNDQIGEAT